VRMWREEGFSGFMRGNGINCLRIVPYRCVMCDTAFAVRATEVLLGLLKMDGYVD